jgi:hypothetical protein
MKIGCAGLLLLGLFLAQVGPSGAAVIRLDTDIVSSGAFDYSFFPDVGRNVECSPSCFTRSSRTDAVAASILTATVNGHQNFGAASMFIDISGRARVGDLGLSASGFAGASTRGSWAAANGGGTASWVDVITITTGAVPLGERIFMEASMNLFGILDAIASGQGRAGAVLTITDLATPSLVGGGALARVEYDLFRGIFIDQPVDDVLPVRLTLTNGARVPFGYAMSLGIGGSSDEASSGGGFGTLPGSMNADAIAINSLHWGGIQRVTDRFGNAIGSFTVESDSGFDFSLPFASSVPEPSRSALMLAALVGVWTWRRWRIAADCGA